MMLMGITGRRDAEDDGADRRDEEGGDAVMTRGAVGTVMVAMELCSDDDDAATEARRGEVKLMVKMVAERDEEMR